MLKRWTKGALESGGRSRTSIKFGELDLQPGGEQRLWPAGLRRGRRRHHHRLESGKRRPPRVARLTDGWRQCAGPDKLLQLPEKLHCRVSSDLWEGAPRS